MICYDEIFKEEKNSNDCYDLNMSAKADNSKGKNAVDKLEEMASTGKVRKENKMININEMKKKIVADKIQKKTVFYRHEKCRIAEKELNEIQNRASMRRKFWVIEEHEELKQLNEEITQINQERMDDLDYFRNKPRIVHVPKQSLFSLPSKDAFFHVIYPDGNKKVAWNLLMISVILFSTTSEAFYIGFGIIPDNDIVIFNIIMDVMFWIDIGLSFRTAYRDEEGAIEADSKKVVYRYLRKNFILDFISSFPIDQFAHLFSSDSSAYLRSTRLFRLLRISRLFRIITEIKIPIVLKDVIHPSFIRAAVFVLTLFLMAHFLACALYCCVTLADDSTYTWADNYMPSDPIRYMPLGIRYQTALYWAFTTLATVGYGDIVPVTDSERGVLLVGVLMGATYFGYTVGLMGDIFRNVNLRNTLYDKKLQFVKDFTKSRKLPDNLTHALTKYYRYFYKHLSVFNCTHLLDRLSTENAAAVQRILHGEIISKFHFLTNSNPIFASRLAALMKPFYLMEGEILFFENDILQQIYFVQLGYVNLITSVDLRYGPNNFKSSMITVASVGSGDFFGEGVILSGEKASYTARASQFTELFYVNKTDLMALLDAWPTAKTAFVKMASAFHEHLDRMRRDFEFYSGCPRLRSFVRSPRFRAYVRQVRNGQINVENNPGTSAVQSPPSTMSEYNAEKAKLGSPLDSLKDDEACNSNSADVKFCSKFGSFVEWISRQQSKFRSESDLKQSGGSSLAVLESVKAIEQFNAKFETKQTRLASPHINSITLWRVYGIIHPEAYPKVLWDVLISVCIIYSVSFESFELAFNYRTHGGLYVLSWIVSVLFFLDMVISFRTSHIDSGHCLMIDKREIAYKYARTYFIIDFISTIPFDILVDPFVDDEESVLGVIRVSKFLRFIRLLRLLRLVKVSRLISRIAEKFQLSPGVMMLLRIGIALFFVCHLAACTFFGVGANQEAAGEPSWLTSYGFPTRLTDVNGTKIVDGDTRFASEFDVSSQYLATLYWAVVTMTTVGFGDIRPTAASTPETALSMCVMLFGTLVTAYVTNMLIDAIKNINLAKRTNDDLSDEMKAFLWELKISPTLTKSLMRQLGFSMKFRGSLDQNIIFDTLPVHLRRRVVHELYFSHLQNLPLIREMESQCPGIASLILPKLRPAVYGEGEIMVSSSMCPREVTFVVLGACQFFPKPAADDDGDDESATATINQGSYFGQDTLFFPSKEVLQLKVYVKALEFTETATLTLDEWTALERHYPTMMEQFKGLLLKCHNPGADMVLRDDMRSMERAKKSIVTVFGHGAIAPVLRVVS